jgi:hypothetical protein
MITAKYEDLPILADLCLTMSVLSFALSVGEEWDEAFWEISRQRFINGNVSMDVVDSNIKAVRKAISIFRDSTPKEKP